MNPFKAWILPIDAGEPPQIWGPPGPWPAPPIYWPGYPKPPQPPGGGEGPPIIWGGGNEPFPTPPIANVPGAPGYRPPIIWGGGNEPFPTPPIYIPKPPPIEPPPGGGESGSISNPIELPPTDALGPNGFWKQAYFPGLNDGKGGWVWVWVPTGKKEK